MTDYEQKQIFARNLREQLERNDMTQKQLAEFLGINPQTVNTWATGTALPRMSKVQQLASIFGVNKSDLLDDVEAAPALSDEERVIISEYRRADQADRDLVKRVLEYSRRIKDNGVK